MFFKDILLILYGYRRPSPAGASLRSPFLAASVLPSQNFILFLHTASSLSR